MQRYEFIKKVNGKLKTIKFPKITPSSLDTIIISKDSDRLDLLAKKFYGDETLYWIIAIANNLGKGSVEILPGTYINIPYDISTIIQNYVTLNK